MMLTPDNIKQAVSSVPHLAYYDGHQVRCLRAKTINVLNDIYVGVNQLMTVLEIKTLENDRKTPTKLVCSFGGAKIEIACGAK